MTATGQSRFLSSSHSLTLTRALTEAPPDCRFEPLLASLVGPPRKIVPLNPVEEGTLTAARRSFQRLAVKLHRRSVRREARRNGTWAADEPETESESESASDAEGEEGGGEAGSGQW